MIDHTVLLAVIIELEVSNRSIPDMRRDYQRYFDMDPNLYSVMAIKMLAGSPAGKHLTADCGVFSLITVVGHLRSTPPLPALPRSAVDPPARRWRG